MSEELVELVHLQSAIVGVNQPGEWRPFWSWIDAPDNVYLCILVRNLGTAVPLHSAVSELRRPEYEWLKLSLAWSNVRLRISSTAPIHSTPSKSAQIRWDSEAQREEFMSLLPSFIDAASIRTLHIYFNLPWVPKHFSAFLAAFQQATSISLEVKVMTTYDRDAVTRPRPPSAIALSDLWEAVVAYLRERELAGQRVQRFEVSGKWRKPICTKAHMEIDQQALNNISKYADEVVDLRHPPAR
ncbi:hypothetical protein PENSPDRAFT_655175 [Peniophora sp. CONT]|nr:hypothetical protein PENSPDRAFT_655175 [Peniophora sp. CONT]